MGDGREGRNKSETKKRDVVCSCSRSRSSMLFERESSINLCIYKKRWERERERESWERPRGWKSSQVRSSGSHSAQEFSLIYSTLLCFQCALVVSLSLCVCVYTHTLSLSLTPISLPFPLFSFYSSLLMDPFNLLVSCDALLVPFSLLR